MILSAGPPPEFPSPIERDTFEVTRFPGPTTIRYRSTNVYATGSAPLAVVSEWRAEDPDLAEQFGLPRATGCGVRLRS